MRLWKNSGVLTSKNNKKNDEPARGRGVEPSMSLLECAARLKDLRADGLGSGCSARKLLLQLKKGFGEEYDLKTNVGIDPCPSYSILILCLKKIRKRDEVGDYSQQVNDSMKDMDV